MLFRISYFNFKSKRYLYWLRSPAHNLKVTSAWGVVGFLNPPPRTCVASISSLI
jgi:hypothetical protein